MRTLLKSTCSPALLIMMMIIAIAASAQLVTSTVAAAYRFSASQSVRTTETNKCGFAGLSSGSSSSLSKDELDRGGDRRPHGSVQSNRYNLVASAAGENPSYGHRGIGHHDRLDNDRN
ncbi:unnamed protein product [Linum trigynum]|uniref:Uncharacterized protein n=1 Tax=Linum trigynum TaxID=586398 RepID=A0AAV2CAX9_9ROSI